MYICYHFNDTTTSTLERFSAKIMRDMFLKIFWLSRILLWPLVRIEKYKIGQGKNNLGPEKWTPKTWCRKRDLNSYFNLLSLDTTLELDGILLVLSNPKKYLIELKAFFSVQNIAKLMHMLSMPKFCTPSLHISKAVPYPLALHNTNLEPDRKQYYIFTSLKLVHFLHTKICLSSHRYCQFQSLSLRY